MTMDEFIEFVQISLSIEQPACKQYKSKAAETRECKEDNREKDVTEKKGAAAHHKNP